MDEITELKVEEVKLSKDGQIIASQTVTRPEVEESLETITNSRTEIEEEANSVIGVPETVD